MPILLVAVWLGARGLNADMVWWDEFLSIRTIGGAHYGLLTPGEIWQRLAAENPWQTPLYFILLNLWGRAVGWTPFALRALSLLFGALTIVVVYRLGRDMISRRVGLYAAAALGGSAFFVGYLHELRAYTLVALLAALSVWLYWRVVYALLAPRPSLPRERGEGEKTQRAIYLGRIFERWKVIGLWIGFVLALAALLYTHYAGGLVVAALGAAHVGRLFWRADEASLVPTWRISNWWRGTAAILLAGVLFLPWASVMVSVGGAIAGNEQRQQLTLDAAGTLAMLAYGLSNGFAPLIGVVVVGSIIKSPPLRPSPAHWGGVGEGIAFIWLTALAVLILTLALNAALPFIAHIRYMMGIAPLWAVLFGTGVDAIVYVGARRVSSLHRCLAPILILGWLALGVVQSVTPTFNDTLFRPEMLTFFRPHLPLNRLADDWAGRALPGDVVALESPLHSWAIAGAFDLYTHPLPVRAVMLDQLPGDEGDYDVQARGFIGDALRAWLAVEHNAPPTFRLAAFEQALGQMRFTRCANDSLTYDGLSAVLYARSPGCCCPPESGAPVVAQFGAGVRLTHVDSLPESVGDSLEVITAWAVDATVPPETYSVALHVLDENGVMVAQADFGLPAPPFACRAATLLLGDVPAGNYTLAALVYDWQTGTRLPVGDGDRALIGTFGHEIND